MTIITNVVSTSLFHCQLYNCDGYVDVEGQMSSTVFVDDISITLLYVSSSDLVLKNNKSEELSFCTIQKYHKQGCRKNVRLFLDMPPSCESIKMTHTKIRTVQIRHRVCSAIVPVDYNCSAELFLCSYLEGIQHPQDTFSVSIFVLFQ